jgi:hypothetical protein
VLNPGQTLQTGQGRAELLLTPGVYVRLGENSALKMDSLSASQVKVELMRGEAVVEVDQVDKNRRLDLIDKGADAHLDRSGVYLFNASDPAIAVYNGKVRVEDDRRGIELGRGQELRLNDAALKPQKFDRAGTDAVYAWSGKRAGYASQVSEWTGEALLGLEPLVQLVGLHPDEGTRADAVWLRLVCTACTPFFAAGFWGFPKLNWPGQTRHRPHGLSAHGTGSISASLLQQPSPGEHLLSPLQQLRRP